MIGAVANIGRSTRGEKTPKKELLPTLTSNGPSADFSRHAYELVDKADGAILVHYMGDEKAAEGFSHFWNHFRIGVDLVGV